MTAPPMNDPVPEPDPKKKTGFLAVLGPGLITGASDDDPSGIATYSQAGAQFGFNMGWTLLVSWPLMCAIQEIAARIGRVTGHGIAGAIRQHYPAWAAHTLVFLLVCANTLNIGADLGAMAAGLDLIAPGPKFAYVCLFAVVSVGLEIFVRYERYVAILKWLTLSLFAYVGVAFAVHMPWLEVAQRLVAPHITLTDAYITTVVAILGTTISPYLFFWQAEEEVETVRHRQGARPLERAPDDAPAEFRRIRLDTWVGMGLSNVVALFIMLTTAATLHAHGVTDIQTSAEAAQALKPIAGQLAFFIFALGIIGTGMLALPVLAGSAAYAVGESLGFHVGLSRKLKRARAFYGVIAAATAVGVLLNFAHVDPIKALFWSAVVNGVVAVPVMIMMMLLSSSRAIMRGFALPPVLKAIGWLATAVMTLTALVMFASWLRPGA
jgi:NRAMP (natural resistance-associated macrophage protein)-like metal ion transporter